MIDDENINNKRDVKWQKTTHGDLPTSVRIIVFEQKVELKGTEGKDEWTKVVRSWEGLVRRTDPDVIIPTDPMVAEGHGAKVASIRSGAGKNDEALLMTGFPVARVVMMNYDIVAIKAGKCWMAWKKYLGWKLCNVEMKVAAMRKCARKVGEERKTEIDTAAVTVVEVICKGGCKLSFVMISEKALGGDKQEAKENIRNVIRGKVKEAVCGKKER